MSDEDLKSNIKVGFSNETKHSGLYKWCIFEDSGKKERDEFIPFEWDIHFKAKNIRYSNKLSNDIDINEAYQKESIAADLIPLKQAGSFKISLFGSETPIEDISLYVEKINSKQKSEKERCTIHVFEEMETEDPYTLGEVTYPSNISFTVRLFEVNYLKLLNQIHDNQISSLSFSVGKVRGFYSGWTPTIAVDTYLGLKVLKKLSDVTFPKNTNASSKKSIPSISDQTYKTSDIEFSLTANTSKEFLTTKDDDLNDDYHDDDLTDNENNKDIHSVQMLEILKEIKKIKVALGVIVLILILYIFS